MEQNPYIYNNVGQPTRARDVRLDLLRVVGVIGGVFIHALESADMSGTDFYWLMIFLPDTAAIFFMASGAIILSRPRSTEWSYIRHRIFSFLPEFVLFSALYAVLNQYFGLVPDDVSLLYQICYMFVTPTWAPGWFILALIGIYLVLPLMAAWVRVATKRQIEIGIAIWLVATIIPVIAPHTNIDVPSTMFGTLFNYAGFALMGYYLERWPLSQRTVAFKVGFFVVTAAIGIGFGYLIGQSGAKWGYMSSLVYCLSINIVMLSALMYGIVIMMPRSWFKGLTARIITGLSLMSLGIYCCHWLVVRYWVIENHVDWFWGGMAALAVAIPVAWVIRIIRKMLVRG